MRVISWTEFVMDAEDAGIDLWDTIEIVDDEDFDL